MPRSGELEAGSKDELETVALVDDADAVRQRHGAPRSPTAARKTTTSAPSSSAAEVTRKALFVGLAALLICSSGLCIREAEDDEGNITYAATSVTLFSEMLKLSLALVITLTSDAPRQKIDARTAAYFLPGAVGYLAVNNVRYFMLEQVNPGLMAIVWNLKICVIGLLYALPPFRRAFTRFQWAGAGLLVVGSTLAEVSQWGATDEFGQSNTGGTLGLEVVAGALVLTSASAVATEYAYKVTDLPLSRQNVILYTYGCLLNLLTALVWRSLEGQSSVPFTRGFTAWTWAVVAAQAASGYAIGALLKYVDAIGQVFADVIAMLITVVFRVVAFGIYILRVNDAGDGVDAALRPRHELPVRGRAAALRRVARGLLLGPDHDGPRGAACGACAADRTRAAEGRRVLRLGALCGVVVVAGPRDGADPSTGGPRPTTVRVAATIVC
ncbi:unnamed protein product [Pelagomonas calceolata]|jgi:hypothetical protein|uniref:Uncharacterized protein n=1 Tax=Pelagomonas calceolata TaxID=35677 RepID=A0A8J2SI86_9STRA|nr:unnamed protein product [Pelagomonas calceolata]